jgi:hypothetical protein
VCPSLFVINIGKQGNQVCCRVDGHHSGIGCHHELCVCLFANQSSFPFTNFSCGITNFSMFGCSEQSGAPFFLTAYTMQVRGWHAIAGNKCSDNLKAVLGTMEAILCFKAWLKESSY